jgi:hypothetical protein
MLYVLSKIQQTIENSIQSTTFGNPVILHKSINKHERWLTGRPGGYRELVIAEARRRQGHGVSPVE